MTIDELLKTIEEEHKELQQYRSIGTVEEVKSIVDIGKWGYRKGYAKAIDEFANRLHSKIIAEIDDCADELEWIEEIAEQMKAGGK